MKSLVCLPGVNLQKRGLEEYLVLQTAVAAMKSHRRWQQQLQRQWTRRLQRRATRVVLSASCREIDYDEHVQVEVKWSQLNSHRLAVQSLCRVSASTAHSLAHSLAAGITTTCLSEQAAESVRPSACRYRSSSTTSGADILSSRRPASSDQRSWVLQLSCSSVSWLSLDHAQMALRALKRIQLIFHDLFRR